MRTTQLIVLAALALATGGCAAEDTTDMHVRIMPAIGTRVTGLHFDQGDRIGLTIRKGEELFVQNRMMVYEGSAFASPGLIWYNDLNQSSTLRAYYPYDQAGEPTQFAVAADQRSGLAASDLLGAVRGEVTPGSTPVGMTFYHLLSQLSVVIDNRSDASIAGVGIDGFVAEASVDLEALTATVKSGAAPARIDACCVTPDALYRVILVPQQGDLTVRVATSDGKEHAKSISAAELAGGKRYDLSVTLTNIDIGIQLSGEVNDWVDGGPIGGGDQEPDPVPDPDSETITYDGVTYKTGLFAGRLWMTENLRYLPSGAELGNGLWYPEKGEAAAAELGMLYSCETAFGGALPAAGTSPQGICPPGWRIPSIDELNQLAADTGIAAAALQYAGLWNSEFDFYSPATNGYLMSSTVADGKCECLKFTKNNQSFTTSIVKVGYGISLRCVKEAE